MGFTVPAARTWDVHSCCVHTNPAHQSGMIDRIAYLRAERNNITQLLQEAREVAAPEMRRTASNRVTELVRRLELLDRALVEWEGAAARSL